FCVVRRGTAELHLKMVSGSRDELINESENHFPHQWASDGNSIISTNGFSFFQLPLGGARNETTLLESEFENDIPRISPDNRWVAYQSRESGTWEIYLASFPTFANKRQISARGG